MWTFLVLVTGSLYTNGAVTFTQLWHVASHNRQLALQAVYFLHQGGVGKQKPRQLEPQLSRVFIHQLADLTQGRPGHRLHYGRELRMKRDTARHRCCGSKRRVASDESKKVGLGSENRGGYAN